MAIVTTHLREVQFEDGTIMKLRDDETIEEVVSNLEASGVAVNVF